MYCEVATTNTDNSTPILSLKPDLRNSLSLTTAAERTDKQVRTGSPVGTIMSRPGLSTINLKPEDYIAFQMHGLHRDLKGVYVYHDHDVYYIDVIVEKRDLALNRKIFEQERAIMHFYRQFRFDLSIIPLANRKLADVFTPRGTQVL